METEYVVVYHPKGNLSNYYKYFKTMTDALNEAFKMNSDENYTLRAVITNYATAED
jgi:hypothetical protein